MEELNEWITINFPTKTVDPEILAQNLKEINENPATVKKDLEAFKQLILKEEDLNAQLDDEFLLRFLRVRKFDQKRAFTLLKDYYKQRQKHKELFKLMKPSLLLHCYEDNFQVPLVDRDHLGRRVGVYRIAKWDPDKFNVSTMIISILAGMEKAIEEPETQVCGTMCILDAKDFTFYQAKHISITDIKNAISLIQKHFPTRLKAVHIVNVGPISRGIIKTAKLFLSEKMKNRIHVHGSDFSALHEFIDPSILPKDFGGHKELVDFKEFYQMLMDSEEYFAKLTSFGYSKKS